MAIFSQFSSLQIVKYCNTIRYIKLIKNQAFLIISSKFFLQFNGLRGRSQIKEEFMFSVKNFVFLLSLTLMHCLSPVTCYARFLFISDQSLRRFGNTIWIKSEVKQATQGQRRLFKDPGMGSLVWLGSEPRTSCSADHCSPNWVNRAALIYFVFLQELLISPWTCLLCSSSTWGFTPSTERNMSKHYFIDSVLEARTNVTKEKDRILIKDRSSLPRYCSQKKKIPGCNQPNLTEIRLMRVP